MRKNSPILYLGLPTILLALWLPLHPLEPGRGPVRHVLNEHLVVFYCHDDSSAMTHLLVGVPTGKGMETGEKGGISFLVSRMALEITEAEPLRQMAESGTSSFCEVHGDFSVLSLRTLTENLAEALNIFADNMADPLFSSIRVSWIREQMATLRTEENEDAGKHSELVHREHFFGNAGYGGSVFGNAESLKTIGKKELTALHRRAFSASAMRLAVVSDRPWEQIAPLIERAFRSLPPGEAAAPAAPVMLSPSSPDRLFHEPKDKKQTLISVAFRLPGLNKENHSLGVLAETLLGKGIESRLWRLRSQNRLAYSIQAKYYPMRGAGILVASLRVSPDKCADALAALKKEIDDLQARGVLPEELEATRKVAACDYLRRNENKDRMAFSLISYEFLGLGFEAVTRFPEYLQEVQWNAFNDYLKGILDPGNRSWVFIGLLEGKAAKQ